MVYHLLLPLFFFFFFFFFFSSCYSVHFYNTLARPLFR